MSIQDMPTPETARGRFLRNNQDLIHLCRMRLTEAERNGDADTAERLRAMLVNWEAIRDKAREVQP